MKKAKFKKKVIKVSKHFDNCLCIASNNDSDKIATFQNGSFDQMAHNLIVFLQADEELEDAVYHAMQQDRLSSFFDSLNQVDDTKGADNDE